jgi:hypothetical protein
MLLAQRGVDLALGRRWTRLLRDAGLVDVEADAYLPLARPAGAGRLDLTTPPLISAWGRKP